MARVCGWSRSTGPTVNAAAGEARAIPKTPSPPLGPHSQATLGARPRPETATSRPCGFCGWRGSRPARRTQALNQMRAVIATAPEVIRSELRDLNVYRLLERASAYRPGTRRDVVSLTKLTLRMLARRAQALEAEIAELDAIIGPLVHETAPALVARPGIGTECASALLIAAGDNPDRLRNEPTFAHLCGAT